MSIYQDEPLANEISIKRKVPAKCMRHIDTSKFYPVLLADEPGNCVVYVRDPAQEEGVRKRFAERLNLPCPAAGIPLTKDAVLLEEAQ
jgi:hypothetical protein